MSKYCPLITCRLIDCFGNLISPYSQCAIIYSEPINYYANHWYVGVGGYVAIYSGEERISLPIPFCINTPFCLSAHKPDSITFLLKNFHAWAVTCQDKCTQKIGHVKLLISIETDITSRKAKSLLVPQIDSNFQITDRFCIRTDQLCDSKRVHSECCIYYKNDSLPAETYQYTTIADGTKRTFRNSDEMKKYGGQGILSPDEVSYFNVFVNGVLQSKKNYVLKKGELTFTTQDIPSKDQTVIILFVTWRNFDCQIMDTSEWQYNAISDGYKKIYTNDDELPEYKSPGIPSPDEVSFFNLYVNGVLQPPINYCVSKGLLKLTTEDAPSKRAFVILESIILRDSKGQLIRVETSNYNAYSNGGKIYTNRDEIQMYGMHGILDPNESSYQNLFINAVLQPHVNYFVRRGYLMLKTEDSPTANAPITLQSVVSTPAVPCCETEYSDAALAQLKKIFFCIKDVDDLTSVL